MTLMLEIDYERSELSTKLQTNEVFAVWRGATVERVSLGACSIANDMELVVTRG